LGPVDGLTPGAKKPAAQADDEREERALG